MEGETTTKSIECVEWLNVNRNARLKVTKKEDNFKKNKNNKSQAKNKPPKNSAEDEKSALYLIQVVGQQFKETCNLLACLSSDQIVNVYEQNKLKPRCVIRQRMPNGKNLNEVGFYKKDHSMLYTCGDDGSLRVFDLRMADSHTNFFCDAALTMNSPTPREFLCADINADDSLFAIGTNKNIDDAMVYIFDLRNTSKHLYQLCESHSMDITQIKFAASHREKFASSSTDGLVCLYDIKESAIKGLADKNNKSRSDDGENSSVEDDDPDFMEQVFNTDSSVQRIGYLQSNTNLSGPDQLYAITYTNGLFVWDLESHELVYRSPKEFNNKDANNNENENDDDYFIDCFYHTENEKSELWTCMGDKRGNVKIYEKDVLISETDRGSGFEKRFHKDIIRSSYWSGDNLYTCGEDGFLLKWDLSGQLIREEVNLKQKERRDDSESDLEDLNEEQMNRKVKFSKKKFSRRNN